MPAQMSPCVHCNSITLQSSFCQRPSLHQEHIPVLYVNIVPRIIHSVKYAETVDYHFLVELIVNFFKKALFPLGEDFFLEEDFVGLFDT